MQGTRPLSTRRSHGLLLAKRTVFAFTCVFHAGCWKTDSAVVRFGPGRKSGGQLGRAQLFTGYHNRCITKREEWTTMKPRLLLTRISMLSRWLSAVTKFSKKRGPLYSIISCDTSTLIS